MESWQMCQIYVGYKTQNDDVGKQVCLDARCQGGGDSSVVRAPDS